ncbi:putative Peptide chain release factor [Hibiscus syriacus]|uniref:Peptide chain release factor n=1 Tax=Hibiscus syriacus TaxID=106335 RepID=A0A6A2Y4J5_HIBSY|nr:putative Peptide chain release factor [Hibiscus syriacus]
MNFIKQGKNDDEEEEINKDVAGISILLVAAVVICVVSTTSSGHDNNTLTLEMKAASKFCSSTEYQESCFDTLSSANNDDPKVLVAKAILAAKEAVKKFLSYLEPLIVEAKNNSLTHMALEDCKNMMKYAADSLWASYFDIRDGNMSDISDRINDLRTWLSAVLSYQQWCLDGFEHDRGMKEIVQKGIVDARELTCNALTIVTNLIHNSKSIPDAVVAQDGRGQFKTIDAALAAAPKRSNVRHVIYIKAGICEEHITVETQYTNILMYGDAAIGNGFIAKSMGFQSTAGPAKHQAVAFRVQSDKSSFFIYRMDGYQDTLYNQANRQFFLNCVISGTIDFIIGDSATIIQNSLIIMKRAMNNKFNTVTAQGKDYIDENTRIIIQNCRIVPEKKLFHDRFRIATYLGRPWKKFFTTVIMESALGDFIRPEGWMWFDQSDKVKYKETVYYGEYNNSGPGADLNARVKWKGYHRMN